MLFLPFWFFTGYSFQCSLIVSSCLNVYIQYCLLFISSINELHSIIIIIIIIITIIIIIPITARNKDMLRLPRVTRNWGKQRVCHHSLKDWNELKRERPEMHRILLLFRKTCLPDFLINPIGKNFCSFSFFALIIFYQFNFLTPSMISL